MTRQGMTIIAEETGFGLEDIEFEHDYRDFEENRMYPPTSRKDPIMTKLTAEHALAIERSRLYLNKALKEQVQPSFQSVIRDDMDRLRDVQMTVVHLLHHPELLLTEDRP